MKEIKKRTFSNGVVYLLNTEDGYPIETTDTFLPIETLNAIGRKENTSKSYGSRNERFMIGVSVMSGCPMRCKFCATGKLKKYRNLTTNEIVEQVDFVIRKNRQDVSKCAEFKINYTRMGDYGLNQEEVKKAVKLIDNLYPNVHHYISTVGIKGMDLSWIKNNITLQLSLHSLSEKKRDWLIPNRKKMSIKELGMVRTDSNLKTTINMTLVDNGDFNIERLKSSFDPKYFFIKLSPLNENCISDMNSLKGTVKQSNTI